MSLYHHVVFTADHICSGTCSLLSDCVRICVVSCCHPIAPAPFSATSPTEKAAAFVATLVLTSGLSGVCNNSSLWNVFEWKFYITAEMLTWTKEKGRLISIKKITKWRAFIYLSSLFPRSSFWVFKAQLLKATILNKRTTTQIFVIFKLDILFKIFS